MAPRTRPYRFYDTAVSICAECYRRVDAKIVFEEGRVFMLKRCSYHGASRVLIADDIEYYRRAREVFLKTPEQVAHYNTRSHWGCPYDCGICPDHEQHGCNIVVEITDGCNLTCPTCYASSSPERMTHRSLEQVERMLDAACRNEVEPDIVQISGGEPTIHPQLFEILDAAKARPIRHLMLNTNGIRIAKDREFAERLARYTPDFEVYLQFDSFRREPLMTLRNADLRSVREQSMARLNELKIPTTLVVTVRRGVNDGELGDILAYALEQPCVRGVTFQPVQAAGRLEQYEGGFQLDRDRLTLTEVRRRILEQSEIFEPEDIIPVPCHADNVAMAYALKTKGGVVPLTGMIDPQILIEGGRNTISYESDESVQGALFELFSTHHSLDSRGDALQGLLGAASAGVDLASLGYDSIFRVLVVEFIDAHAFDLRSIRKTCVHIAHPDGERIIPFDTYNMLYRDDLEERVLAPLREELRVGPKPGPLRIRCPS